MSRYRLLAVTLLGMLSGLSGCASYNWKVTYADYQAAEKRAREQDKYMFVFFKYWLDSDSNRMLGDEVLSNAKVVALFQNTENCLVEKDGDKRQYEELKLKYGVKEPPASVIVAPDGKFVVREGLMTRDAFIEWAGQALSGSATDARTTGREPAP